MDLEKVKELQLAAETEEPIREVCLECEGIPNEHDSASGPWINCLACNHMGYVEYFPKRNAFIGAMLTLAPYLLNLWEACSEQVDSYDKYVHDLTPIIEAMDKLEEL